MLTRLKVMTGYTAAARWWAEVDDALVGYIPRQPDIASPYAYSATDTVWRWSERNVICREVKHRRFEVFEVPASFPIHSDELAVVTTAPWRTS